MPGHPQSAGGLSAARPSLADVLARVERRERVTGDPWLTLVPPDAPGRAAVVSLPGFVVVAADVDRPWVDSWMRTGDFAEPIGPDFLVALQKRLGVVAGNLDVMLLGDPLPGDPSVALTPVTGSDHSRVARALRYRTDVRAWTTPYGILVLGRGLGGRWEVAFEVDETARGRGHGRALARAARHLLPGDRPVWAQCSPGNASSLRALLAAGYVPVGSEILLMPE